MQEIKQVLRTTLIGPLQWYKIRHSGTQTAHWDIQCTFKEDLSLSDLSRFVLEVPVCCFRSSMADFVPCDRILQRAHCNLVRSHSDNFDDLIREVIFVLQPVLFHFQWRI